MKVIFLLAILLLPLFVSAQSEKQPDTAKTQQKMYVVNGISIDQDSLVNIDSNEIESIYIIKDGAKIGMDCYTCPQVILITTKKPIEHRIYVIANGFDSFLATQPSKIFYTKESLKNKNILMVNEWNRRYKTLCNMALSMVCKLTTTPMKIMS